jgi:hypothetical protein
VPQTEREKFEKRAERRLAKLQAKAQKDAPLFAADLVPATWTANDERWKWRRDIARAVERLQGTEAPAVGLAWIKVQARVRLAEQWLSPDALAELRGRLARIIRDNHGPEHALDTLYQALKDVVPGFKEGGMRNVLRPPQPPEAPHDGGLADLLASLRHAG